MPSPLELFIFVGLFLDCLLGFLPRYINEGNVPPGPEHPQPDPVSAASAFVRPRHRMQNSWVSGASMGPEHSVQTLDMLERQEGNPSSCVFSTAVLLRMRER